MEVVAAGTNPVSSSVSMTVYGISVSERKDAQPQLIPGTTTVVIPAAQVNYATAVDGQTVVASSSGHGFTLSGNDQILRASGGVDTVTASGNRASITLGADNDQVTLGGTGSVVDTGAGINTVNDNGRESVFMLAPAGQGVMRIYGNVFANGARFDLRPALTAAGWNGQMSSLADYLSVRAINNGADLQIAVRPTGWGWTGVATLYGQGGQTLDALLARAMLPGQPVPDPVYPPSNTVTLLATQTNFTGTTDGLSVIATAGDHTILLSGNDQTLKASGGIETVTASGDRARITTGAANDQITVSGAGDVIDPGIGINTITDNGFGNTFVLPAAGQGANRIFGSEFANGAKFDLGAALKAAGWNGDMTQLSNYLTVRAINNGADLQVALRPTGWGWTGVATLYGQGSQTMSSFLARARLSPPPASPPTPTTVTVASTQASYTATSDCQTVLATAGDHGFVMSGSDQVLTATGGIETVTASGDRARITTGAANDQITVSGAGDVIDPGTGINTITDNGFGNTFVLPAATTGADRIFGAVFTNGAKFDLRTALKGIGWGGQVADLGTYLTVRQINSGADLQVAVKPAGWGSWTGIATLYGQGAQSMTAFLQHAILQ
ncbi:DUF3060 domain-containing protein [Rhodovastum atsumiense]|uniref:DUF3060 domain-containing protein n=1 Tax=Rhodovastum atsumiense TaxID=504468 RepID=UPI001EF11172|nr:DUF3060 domain-containing protein [Rhodovastum atsumiense]